MILRRFLDATLRVGWKGKFNGNSLVFLPAANWRLFDWRSRYLNVCRNLSCMLCMIMVNRKSMFLFFYQRTNLAIRSNDWSFGQYLPFTRSRFSHFTTRGKKQFEFWIQKRDLAILDFFRSQQLKNGWKPIELFILWEIILHIMGTCWPVCGAPKCHKTAKKSVS